MDTFQSQILSEPQYHDEITMTSDLEQTSISDEGFPGLAGDLSSHHLDFGNGTGLSGLESIEEIQCHLATWSEDGMSLTRPLDFLFDTPHSEPAGSFLPASRVLTAIKRIFVTETNQTGAHWNVTTVSDVAHCNRSWDKLICWPEIPQGHSVSVPCFSSLNNIAYDTSRTVTRACKEGGFWEKTTNYSNCEALSQARDADDYILEITTWVYFFGYCLSLTALVLALTIFISFQELRCLRNRIHTHLILTYIFADALWLITSIQSHIVSHGQWSCVTFILLHYFHLTNFFWMFVEGLYLYVLVVKTFTAENIKLWTYAFIGWGIPLLIVVGWSIVKWMTKADPGVAGVQVDPDSGSPPGECLWLTVNVYDWIYKSPAILVLAANILFLLTVMWVLITKLRSATNPETQQSRKAAKALVVLMPLLGITYLLVLTGSKQPIYEHVRALLISTQGFLVALLYCFLNGEVRKAVRRGWTRCRGPHLFCCDCERERLQQIRDWSLPRSRTESIQLYQPSTSTTAQCQNNRHSHFSRGRIESTVSEMTTLTNITTSSSLLQFGNLRAGSSGSASFISTRPSSMPTPTDAGCSVGGGSARGKDGFDQILPSPTLTSISGNLSTVPAAPPAEASRPQSGSELVPMILPASPQDLADVDFIDNLEGQHYGV